MIAPSAVPLRIALVLAPLLAFQACHAVPAFAQGAPTTGSYRRVQVTDGDSVVATVPLGAAATIRIRVQGLDAPELQGACAWETQKAAAAKARLEQLTARGVRIVTQLDTDVYGRLLAKLYDRQGRDVAEVLIAEGLARPMGPRDRRQPWCPAPEPVAPIPVPVPGGPSQ